MLKHPWPWSNPNVEDLAMDMMIEEWRAVKGEEGRYEVSSHGRIRSVDHESKACHRGITPYIRKVKGKILKCYLSKGYLRWSPGGTRHESVHRTVAAAFLGCVEVHDINHIDFNRRNNSLSNLEIVTRKQNVEHNVSHGHHVFGEKCHGATHDGEQVRAALLLYEQGEKLSSVSDKTGVSMGVILRAANRQTWKHLGQPDVSDSRRIRREKIIRECVELVASGVSRIDACDKTGVSYMTLSQVLSGRQWKHLGLSLRRAQ
jgi:hypothetical protein